MKIVVAAVGRARKGPERDLFDQYAARLRWPFELKEVEEKRPLPTPERMAREAELLLAAVPEDAILVALDERGKHFTSGDFARKLEHWRDDGNHTVAFLIGGADGHGSAVKARARLTLSLSDLTWPHMLVRAMLAEQLFRAQCILEGHPYHRE